MKIRVLIILFIISLAFNLGILVKVLFKSPQEEEARETGCFHNGWKHSAVCLQLNLNRQQLNQMENYREQFQNRISPLTIKLEKERLELFRLLKKDTLDEKETNKILGKISSLQAGIQKHFIHHFFQIKKIFNSHQQRKFYYFLERCLYKGSDGSYWLQDSPCENRSQKKEKSMRAKDKTIKK